jgi:hypothetical protein
MQHQEAVRELVALLQKRKEEDGFAWYAVGDSKPIMERHGLARHAMSGLWGRAKRALKSRVERFTGHLRVRETVSLIKILKDNNVTELNDHIRGVFAATCPGVKLTGPLVGAACRRAARGRRRADPDQTASEKPRDVSRAESILQEIADLEDSIRHDAERLTANRRRMKELLRVRGAATMFVRAYAKLNTIAPKHKDE